MLTDYQAKARTHALLCSIGFLIILPLGVLWARYARTFTNKWLYVHAPIQLFIAGPIILTGWVFGYKLAGELGATPHFTIDIHQKIGLSLLILYLIQLLLGIIVHYFKFPFFFRGHRPPHSYLHVVIGLAILALASYQVHLGLYVEWPNWIGLPIPLSATRAWLALTIVFWVLYAIGWAFLPRQFKMEAESRKRFRM